MIAREIASSGLCDSKSEDCVTYSCSTHVRRSGNPCRTVEAWVEMRLEEVLLESLVERRTVVPETVLGSWIGYVRFLRLVVAALEGGCGSQLRVRMLEVLIEEEDQADARFQL